MLYIKLMYRWNHFQKKRTISIIRNSPCVCYKAIKPKSWLVIIIIIIYFPTSSHLDSRRVPAHPPISSIVPCSLLFQEISQKFTHNFYSNHANRQTNTMANK